MEILPFKKDVDNARVVLELTYNSEDEIDSEIAKMSMDYLFRAAAYEQKHTDVLIDIMTSEDKDLGTFCRDYLYHYQPGDSTTMELLSAYYVNLNSVDSEDTVSDS